MSKYNNTKEGKISDYMADARGFWSAAKSVYEDCVRQEYPFVDTFNPLVFLLGHSSECLFKACAIYNDKSYKSWNAFNHDLEKLRLNANFNFSKELCEYTAIINKNFSKYEHRYRHTFTGNNDETPTCYSNTSVRLFLEELDKEITRARELVDPEGYKQAMKRKGVA